MYKVAVVGATGLVGQEMIKVLAERNFPLKELYPFATYRSAGKKLKFKGKEVTILNIRKADFKGIDLALFAGGEIASSVYVPQALKAGCLCIDNSATFRMEKEVPLVVPEVNPHAIQNHKGLIANPNCTTIQLVLLLKPLEDKAGLKKVVVSTYQSVSGTGKAALRELYSQSRAVLKGKGVKIKVYPQQIAFNLFAQIGSLNPEGYFGEEEKMVEETRKIMGLPQLEVVPTCVRVPVVVGHCESIYVELREDFSPQEARELFSKAPGVEVLDFPAPVSAAGKDEVYVGRIRRAGDRKNALAFFAAADNLRVGAATNAVKIAELIIKTGEL